MDVEESVCCMMIIILNYYRGEKTMKLNLLFTGMDLVTILAYPIVIMYGRLSRIY